MLRLRIVCIQSYTTRINLVKIFGEFPQRHRNQVIMTPKLTSRKRVQNLDPVGRALHPPN